MKKPATDGLVTAGRAAGTRAETESDAAAEADLGGQVRGAVGRLYRRFRSERPEGSLGDAALEVLTRLHKAGPQTLTELSELARATRAQRNAWLDGQLRALSPEDRAVIARATTLLSRIADA